jgi:hypothetical protein
MKVLIVVGDGAREAGIAADLARDLAEHGWGASLLGAARGTGATRLEQSADADRGAEGHDATLVRTDPAPRHWQRTRSTRAAQLVRERGRAIAPDLVHVLAWRGTTHDLVAACAQVSIPCVVTLGDPWFGCLVGDRVHRPSGRACAEPLGPSACLACAGLEFGATPWVPMEAGFMAVAERRRDILRELVLARRVIVSDDAEVEAARRALSDTLVDVRFAHVPDPRDARAHVGVYADALSERSPMPAEKPPEWWAERLQVEAERAWDDASSRGPGCEP